MYFIPFSFTECINNMCVRTYIVCYVVYLVHDDLLKYKVKERLLECQDNSHSCGPITSCNGQQKCTYIRTYTYGLTVCIPQSFTTITNTQVWPSLHSTFTNRDLQIVHCWHIKFHSLPDQYLNTHTYYTCRHRTMPRCNNYEVCAVNRRNTICTYNIALNYAAIATEGLNCIKQ